MGGCLSVEISRGCATYVFLAYKRYIFDLRENINFLKAEVENVQARLEDVLHRIYREESKGHKRLVRVQHWVIRVGTAIQEANEVLDDAQDGINMLCIFGLCSTNFLSSYEYGKKVCGLLQLVKTLCFDDFDVVAESPIYTKVLTPVLVGQEITLEKTLESLMDDGVGVLGLYGMGGVGKTELFSRLYSAISTEAASPFYSLIWLVVSRSVQINRIQDNIGEILAIYNEEWEQKSLSQKVMSIHRSLGMKRYLLVLDNVWGKLNLEEIGIPLPTRENGCKIVIISRSRNVCEAMRADAFIEVKPLEENEAWDLFRKNVGETILQSHPEVQVLARQISDRCHGLPLALQVFGASMSSRRSLHEWRHALDEINSEFGDPNREDIIFQMLKSIYDALDEEVKMCFLFCALFPEDQEIRKDELVDLWKGEQIIDDRYYYQDVKVRGFNILGTLLDNQLLKEAGEFRDKVIMHNLVREMALSIASHPKEEKENFIVGSYTQVGGLSNIKDGRNVSRVSLVGEDIKTISGDFDCPKLKTLLLRDTKLETISPEFFPRLPVLLVLDLSLNKYLNILPDEVSKLVSLLYLNLSSTGIKRLPPGLSKLNKLKYLNLEHTHMLEDITGISHLVSIEVLRLCDSGFRVSCDLVEELQILKHLEILTITLQDEDVVQQFLSSPKLVKCTQGFYLKHCTVLSSISITPLSHSLRCLDVQYSFVPEMKIDHSFTGDEAIITSNASPSNSFFTNLSEVRLAGCNGLRELTWLLFAPNLTTLLVVQSRDIKEIINQEKAADLSIDDPFQSLEFLALEGLDKLRSIYWSPLSLPRLREIRLISCPGLRKLPLNLENAKGHNLVISAEKELMKRMEWEDEETKQWFFPSKALCNDFRRKLKLARHHMRVNVFYICV